MRFLSLRDVHARLQRSVPVLGIVLLAREREARLEAGRREDAKYLETMAALGNDSPRLAGATEEQERWRLLGEALGHALALALGAFLWRWLRDPFLTALWTWALAFLAGALGDRGAVRLHGVVLERRNPDPDD